MTNYQYYGLRDKPELMDSAAGWFHSKWGVPKEAYLECMEAYLNRETELGWFLCLIEAYLADPEKATSNTHYDNNWVREAKYRTEMKAQEAEDFRDYSRYVSTETDNLWDKAWSQYSMGYNDLTYEYINNHNGIRDEISSKGRAYNSDTKAESSFAEKHLNYPLLSGTTHLAGHHLCPPSLRSGRATL